MKNNCYYYVSIGITMFTMNSINELHQKVRFIKMSLVVWIEHVDTYLHGYLPITISFKYFDPWLQPSSLLDLPHNPSNDQNPPRVPPLQCTEGPEWTTVYWWSCLLSLCRSVLPRRLGWRLPPLRSPCRAPRWAALPWRATTSPRRCLCLSRAQPQLWPAAQGRTSWLSLRGG